jgi:hypothetical protein
MAECECLAGCPFFNDKLKEKPATAALYKKTYCLGGSNDKCARHQIKASLGKEYVPSDLLPSQIDKAQSIIENFRKS